MAAHLLNRLAILALGTLAFSGAARAQTFDVDFARPSVEPPLIKIKFGVYQTPLTTLPRLLDSVALLREANGLLNLIDVSKVYWAQWLDAGAAPGIGLISFDGHRKAIYNAFVIYGMMPVDRNEVVAQNNSGLDAMASLDAHRARVVIWNASEQAQTATINLRHLPFSNGILQTLRIDAEHASSCCARPNLTSERNGR